STTHQCLPSFPTRRSSDLFAIPLTALQVAAEQSPFGPRNSDGRTYLAEERAATENAKFLRVEVNDFVAAKGHLPDPDIDWRPNRSEEHTSELQSRENLVCR